MTQAIDDDIIEIRDKLNKRIDAVEKRMKAIEDKIWIKNPSDKERPIQFNKPEPKDILSFVSDEFKKEIEEKPLPPGFNYNVIPEWAQEEKPKEEHTGDAYPYFCPDKHVLQEKPKEISPLRAAQEGITSAPGGYILKSEHELTRKLYDAQKIEISDLELKLKQYIKSCELQHSEIERKDKEIARLKDELVEFRKEDHESTQMVSRLCEQLQEKQTVIDADTKWRCIRENEHRAEIRKLQDEVQEKQCVIEKLRNACGCAPSLDYIERLEKENAELKENSNFDHSEYKRLRNELQQQLTQAQKDLKIIVWHRDQGMRLHEQYREQIKSLTTQLEEANKEIIRTKEMLDRSAENFVECDEKLEEEYKKNASLSDQLSGANRLLDEANKLINKFREYNFNYPKPEPEKLVEYEVESFHDDDMRLLDVAKIVFLLKQRKRIIVTLKKEG